METIYAHELQGFARDSQRSLRGYRARYAIHRGLASLESVMLFGWLRVLAVHVGSYV